MSVRLEGNVIQLIGECRIEDAEPLSSLLLADPKRQVDIGQSSGLHSAVIQALIVLAPAITGGPADNFVRDWIVPRINSVQKLTDSDLESL